MADTAKEVKVQENKKEQEKVIITCCDCSKPREINKGEAFQVTRCEACQVLHRKQLRKGYRKNRINNLRVRILGLEGLLRQNNITIPG